MSKKDKNKKKQKETKVMVYDPAYINLAPISPNIKLEIAAVENEQSVHIVMTGFNNFDDVVDYSEYLAEYLPLLLYQTKVIQ